MDVLQLFLWLSFAVAKTQQECVEHALGTASRLTDDNSLHKSLVIRTHREDEDVLNDLETKFRCYSQCYESCILSSKHIGWVGPRIFNINLSARNLNGTMPSSLGNLTHLEHLDLSHNNLEGSLPDLSRLTMLKTLNLQNNKLNGILPAWLRQQTSLKVLLIQNNDFSGEIPCQLHYSSELTLNFSGNPLLRLPKECHTDSSQTWATKTIVFSWGLISFILTVILVFLGGIIVLKWKNATCNLRTGLFLPEKENANITKTIAEEDSKDSNIVNDENESRERCYVDSSIAKVTRGSKPQVFTTEEIVKVTENFSSEIGKGGFGSVYMGTLEDSQKVAVKVHSNSSHQGKQEFLNELELLCRVNHKYLVSLIGYNSANAKLMLIYQYMPGGPLNERLYGPKSEGKELSWRERLHIALDVARGLEYLHGGCNTKFIHRDIKTANIFLDSKLRGKLGDFGLAKGTMDHEVSHITTIVKGTPGYLDPEYFKTQMLTDKSDIYSFGVVLLEILFGRQAVNLKLPENQVNLVRWAMPYLEMKQQRRLIKAIDKRLIGRFSNIKSIRRVAKVAMACVHEDPSWRPVVSDVIRDLKQAIQDEDKPNTRVKSSYIAMLSVNGVRNLATFFSSQGKKANIHIDKKGKNQNNFQDFSFESCSVEEADGSMLRKFKLEDINEATQKFSEILGQGGFGRVYKGVMKDGSIIAVKVLSLASAQGKIEFLNELTQLSRVNHKNLVSLLGYCRESQKYMLVYEYMSGGSLESHLYNKSTGNGLKWIERVQIALDIAQGLEYLHGGSNSKVIHRDVKTSNILLDDNLRAKLSDFGFSKCFENSCVSHVTTRLAGTYGYMSPEYVMYGRLTEKSDIYSFGVVLLEIICCRRPCMYDDSHHLITYVKDRVRLENPETITRIIDSKLAKTTLNIKSVFCATQLALACVEMEKSCRPSATQVVKQLLEAIEVENSPRYSALDGYATKIGESGNLPTGGEIPLSYNGIYETDDSQEYSVGC